MLLLIWVVLRIQCEDSKFQHFVISRIVDRCRVERSFIIDNGELLVYRDHHPNAKVKVPRMSHSTAEGCMLQTGHIGCTPKFPISNFLKQVICYCHELTFTRFFSCKVDGWLPQAMYQLKDATCFYEDRNSASLPKWTEGAPQRCGCKTLQRRQRLPYQTHILKRQRNSKEYKRVSVSLCMFLGMGYRRSIQHLCENISNTSQHITVLEWQCNI